MDGNIEHWLFRLGVPTYKTYLQIDLGTTANQKIEIADKVPENVGWIYGLSVQKDGSFPYDATIPLISNVQSYQLWLTLKYATSDFVDTWRLSDLIYTPFVPAPVIVYDRQQERNYTPVSIPMGVDWRKSTIINPTGIVNATIFMDVYFIDLNTYKNMRESGVIGFQGKFDKK